MLEALNTHAAATRNATVSLRAAGPIVAWPPNRMIMRAGERQKHLHLLRSGWAMRVAPAIQERKPVISFLLPGDIFDIESFIADRKSTHSVRSLGGCQTEIIPFSSAIELQEADPGLHTLCVEQSATHIGRIYARLAALGSRDARGRMVQLLLELHQRLSAIGAVEADAFECPVRQSQFADALGLTPVHVNRVLRRLQGAGLLVIKGRKFSLPDLPRLWSLLDEGQ